MNKNYLAYCLVTKLMTMQSKYISQFVSFVEIEHKKWKELNPNSTLMDNADYKNLLNSLSSFDKGKVDNYSIALLRNESADATSAAEIIVRYLQPIIMLAD